MRDVRSWAGYRADAAPEGGSARLRVWDSNEGDLGNLLVLKNVADTISSVPDQGQELDRKCRTRKPLSRREFAKIQRLDLRWLGVRDGIRNYLITAA